MPVEYYLYQNNNENFVSKGSALPACGSLVADAERVC